MSMIIGAASQRHAAPGEPTYDRNGLYAAAYAEGLHSTPALTKPNYLETVIDPTFGGRITRISDDPGEIYAGDIVWQSSVRHEYSTTGAWSRTNKHMIIKNRGAVRVGLTGAPEHVLLNGSTYVVLDSVYPDNASGQPANEFRWSADSDDELVCVRGNEIYRYNVVSKTRTSVMNVTGVSELYIGAYQGNLSRNGRYIVVINGNTRDTSGLIAILCDLQTGTEVVRKTLNQPDVDYALCSASGNYILVNGAESSGDYDRTRIYDTSFVSIRFLGDLGNPSHFDTGYDANGHEVVCGVRKTVSDFGKIMTHRLSDGTVDTHTVGGYSEHQSMRNYNDDGWMVATYPQAGGYDPIQREIVKVYLSAANVKHRLCHHRSTQTNYWAQPQGCPDVYGDRIVFASDWGSPNGEDTGCYVVSYPPGS